MTRRQQLLLSSLIWLMVLSLSATYAEACTCRLDPNPPCRAAGLSDVIFDAEVLRAEKIEPDTDHYLRRRFTMKVRKTYKGLLGDAVYVYTGVGDSDCGYRFRVGNRYLIYADAYDGRLTTGICTRTRKIADADEDRAYFKQLPNMAPGITIFGQVVQRAEPRGWDGIPGIKIEINGPEKTTILTDAKGGFSVSGLMPGEYRVTAALPDRFKLSPGSLVELYPYARYEEKIPDKGCLQTYFVLEAKT